MIKWPRSYFLYLKCWNPVFTWILCFVFPLQVKALLKSLLHWNFWAFAELYSDYPWVQTVCMYPLPLSIYDCLLCFGLFLTIPVRAGSKNLRGNTASYMSSKKDFPLERKVLLPERAVLEVKGASGYSPMRTNQPITVTISECYVSTWPPFMLNHLFFGPQHHPLSSPSFHWPLYLLGFWALLNRGRRTAQ